MRSFREKQKIKQQNYANPSKRFLAFSIDNFLLFVARYLIAKALLYLWFAQSFVLFANEYQELTKQGIVSNSNKDFLLHFLKNGIFYEFLLLAFIVYIIGALYWIIFPITKYQATPGKLLFKLKITNAKDQKLDLSESIYRYIIALTPWLFHITIIFCAFTKNLVLLIICVVVVSLWYDTAIFRRSLRSMHDIICDTKVVRKN